MRAVAVLHRGCLFPKLRESCPAGHIFPARKIFIFQSCLQIFRAENVLRSARKARFTHRDNGDLLRIPAPYVADHGIGVDKASRDDFLSARCRRVHDSLRAGAGRVDDCFAGNIKIPDLGRGIAEIAAFNLCAAPLSQKNIVRVFLFHCKSVFDLSNRVDLSSSFFKQIAFERKRAEYINDDSKALRFLRAFDQFQYPNIHFNSSPVCF